METSEAINELAGALTKAQAAMKPAVKDSTNPHFKSRYADLASVWDAARTALTSNGLSVLQGASAEGERVTVTTLLLHTSGQWVKDALTSTARDAGAQSVGSAITYGRRYGMSAMVGIAPEDDDAEAATQRQPFRPEPVEIRPTAVKSAGKPVDAVPHFETGELGPLTIQSVGPARTGAQGEVFFTNGDALLAFKKTVVTDAKLALAAGHVVPATVKVSTSGNRYLDDIKPTGMTAAQLDATKWPTAPAGTPVHESEIAF